LGISDDNYAVLLLCTDLALKRIGDETRPFTVLQWFKLAEKLVQNGFTPSKLFDVSKPDVKDKLFLSGGDIERIERLLSRAGQFGVELSALNEKGIFTLTRSDSEYPLALKMKLKKYAPPVLYYAGNLRLLSNKGVAVVGSRNIDQAGIEFTQDLSKRCTNDGLNVISGGARGVDSIAEKVANNEEGTTVIFLADSLEKKIRNSDTRNAIIRKQSVILSSYRPDMPFQTYVAMERNKYIYSLSDFSVVVSSDYKKGGTWAGAIENLKRNYAPLFVRSSSDNTKGNAALLRNENVYEITREVLENNSVNIYDWFSANSLSKEPPVEPQQLTFADL
jgi:predicted Rossmann fold nucleotide-binding protein DprA/Smf involved in DNA uptake